MHYDSFYDSSSLLFFFSNFLFCYSVFILWDFQVHLTPQFNIFIFSRWSVFKIFIFNIHFSPHIQKLFVFVPELSFYYIFF